MLTSEWSLPQNTGQAPFVARQAEFLRRNAIDVDVFHFRGAMKPNNYLVAWWQVRRKLRSRNYDLIHAQFGQSGILAYPKILPVVVTFRGSDVLGIIGSNGQCTVRGQLLRCASWLVGYFADEVVVVSETLKQFLPSRPVNVIPSGVDLDLFHSYPKEEARRRVGLPSDKTFVLFAASPDNPVKRYALAEDAMRCLVDEYQSNAELVVASGAPYVDMPLYMSACDVLLVTSLHEGSPNVVKEALACDLPVVSTDVGDVRERIRGVPGCEIVAASPQEIARALHRILLKGERTNGRCAVLNLDESVLTQRLIRIYERLVK